MVDLSYLLITISAIADCDSRTSAESRPPITVATVGNFAVICVAFVGSRARAVISSDGYATVNCWRIVPPMKPVAPVLQSKCELIIFYNLPYECASLHEYFGHFGIGGFFRIVRRQVDRL